jgi:hypothetical protein
MKGYIAPESLNACLNLNFPNLLVVRRIGLRNGNWRRLSLVDRGLFKCALWVTKVQGSIASLKLLVKVLGIALMLLENSSMRIWMAGKARAEELKQRFNDRGLFDWAPRVRVWLEERNFAFYLGLGEMYGP